MSRTDHREAPPRLEAEPVRMDTKCAPEPRREEMPARKDRVKALTGGRRGAINESGTANYSPLMSYGHGRLLSL